MKTFIIFIAALLVIAGILKLAALRYPTQVKRLIVFALKGAFCILAVCCYIIGAAIYVLYRQGTKIKWSVINIVTEFRSPRRLEKIAEKKLKKFRKAPSFYGRRKLDYLENLCLLLQQQYHFVPNKNDQPYRWLDDYNFLLLQQKIEERYQFWSDALKDIKNFRNLRTTVRPNFLKTVSPLVS